MSKPTQAERILAYMREHPEGITAMTALQDLGCFRLAARIYDLRREGHQITEETHTTDTGKHVARYRLIGIAPTPAPAPIKLRVWVCAKCGADAAYLHETLLGEGYEYGVGKCPTHGKHIVMAVHRDVAAVWVTGERPE